MIAESTVVENLTKAWTGLEVTRRALIDIQLFDSFSEKSIDVTANRIGRVEQLMREIDSLRNYVLKY